VKKKLFISLLIFTVSFNAIGQDNFYVSQYHQIGPVLNPAFTGVDNFLDIKLNYRNQWTGFTDAPSTNYFGVNGYLQKETQHTYKQYALRTSNPYYLDSLEEKGISLGKQLRHGIGGNVVYDIQGPYQQISGYLNYAIHIPLSQKTKISIGVAGKLSNQRIDMEKLVLYNPTNDDFYQSLIAAGGRSTFLSINPGILLYSNKFYISYAAQNIMHIALSSDEVLTDDTPIDHIIMAGVRLPLSGQVSLLPSLLLTHNQAVSNKWDAGMKVLIRERVWAGMSYRSTKTFVIMAGVYINNLVNLSYSYDYVMSELNNYTNGSHELVLGLMLFKKDTKAPFLW
jgi:type IX secretion system PorP/SprF family membrane protein